ncbi:putative PAS/PAC sensor protein (plasmid) [Haloterrigena turkmenica DSM 5511]|uniref:PAS/PAC sensor protein n=1 Tax=Haloterrigena turkmenica (strain ATCC 51198 / DSM 5511 / JCM 9101 / NCIMB 13204 / VKM B-1734 / 4k) TaxID=543526 RepID=D2S144_HALTV|nr:bacterio-opsin activator domain-containing protein [Haloterrigena turkmenica]ADB63091.1 putative PAS/PAC sensor protein [Haloterrigena turkmenica DSM 5511]
MTSRSLTEALRETLALFDEAGIPRTTTELADDLELGRRSTYERLERLVERGELETKRVGASARVWWRPPSARTDRPLGSGDWPVEAESLLAAALDRTDIGVFVLDESFNVAWLNETAERYFDLDRERVLGRNKRRLVETDIASAVDDATAFVDTVLATYDDNTYAERFECRVTAEEEREPRWLEHRSEPIETGAYAGGRIELYHDVTDRKQRASRERELEQYERLVETVPDGVYAVDEDARFVAVNDGFCELTGYDRDELLGAHATTVHDAEITTRAESLAEEIATGERGSATIELDLQTDGGATVPCESRLAPFPLGETDGRCGVVRDVSDRIERERTLRRRIRQQEVVADLGQRALESRDLDELLADAADLLTTTLETDYSKALVLDRTADELRLRQGSGWDPNVVGTTTVSAIEDESQAAYTLASGDPVLVDDLDSESRFSGPDLLTDHDVTSGISVIIGSSEDPWGVLGVHDTDHRAFSEHDVAFVQSVANVLATAIDRNDRERELKRQHEQLAALDSLNGVVRDIIDEAIDRSTREEIERSVCEHLAATDSYLFAWIGDVDAADQTVNVRTEAGGVAEYLEGIAISVDPDDERSGGATGRAVRKREIQTTQDIRDDSRYEPWRGHLEEYEIRSSAAIPIVHEETIYGVLSVYADRPNAFDGRERAVLGQLGDVIGHAIASTERKRALMSDDVVELDFRIRDLLDELDLDVPSAGRITLDHTVPIEDDEFLVYGSATPDAIDGLEAIVETLPHWKAVTYRGGDAATRFELRLSEPPVLSTVASLGGSVESAVIEGGDYRMTIHVASGAKVRQVVNVVQDAYPTAELLKHRQLERRQDTTDRARHALTAVLTDRQRSALEAAYHAGYYEWPRDASGEEVAESLEIAPPTFNQHLRKAQRKVFDSLLSRSGQNRSTE